MEEPGFKTPLPRSACSIRTFCVSVYTHERFTSSFGWKRPHRFGLALSPSDPHPEICYMLVAARRRIFLMQQERRHSDAVWESLSQTLEPDRTGRLSLSLINSSSFCLDIEKWNDPTLNPGETWILCCVLISCFSFRDFSQIFLLKFL